MTNPLHVLYTGSYHAEIGVKRSTSMKKFVLRMISWSGTGQKNIHRGVNTTVMYRKEN